MSQSDLDATISVKEAAETLISACFYTNDNADPTGIHDAKLEADGSFIVRLYHGCDVLKKGRLQRFRVTVESLPDDDPQGS